MSQQQGASEPEDLLPTAEYATDGELKSTGDTTELPRGTSATEQSDAGSPTPPPTVHSAGSPPFTTSSVASTPGLAGIFPVKQHSTSPLRKILKQDAGAYSSLHPDTWKQSSDLYKPGDDRSSLPLALERRRVEQQEIRQSPKDYDVKQHEQKEAEKKTESKKRLELATGDLTKSPRDTSTSLVTSGFLNTPPHSLNLRGCFSVIRPSNALFLHTSNSRLFRQIPTTASREIRKQDASAEQSFPRNYSISTNTLPAPPHLQLSSRDSCVTRKISYLSRCHSMSSLSKIPRTENKLTRSISLPDIMYKEFTPVITADFDDETYRFQCSSPGLYLCSVTGLMFGMKGEGDVVYRIVPWNRRLLSTSVQHRKKPAGPLFDITCVQQRVSQLHLPHCEISSTGGAQFLSVAHVTDDGDVEFIGPQKTTETHVVISITGFSAYGNVKDENSPPDPVRALVLLFYRPPADPDADLTSFLNVLLAPGNVVLRHVLRFRKKINGHEMFIEASPYCNLKPKKVYRLSTSPQDDSVKIQPRKVQFHEESHSNYLASFQVILETIFRKIKLKLKDKNCSQTVWKRRVYLPSTGERRSPGQRALNLPPNKRLLHVRSRFVEAISEPVLNSLLDKLLEKKVISDSERESVDVEQTRGHKARVVIDTVRKKGEAASSEMIHCFCELDPFLCEHLGLK